VAALATVAIMAACAPLPPRNPMATWVPSKNHDIRKPQLIVLHFTNQGSVQQALDTLRTRNPDGPVSAHYLIGRDGHIYQLVSDTLRAWHAGPGRWGTITDVNSASIGIEIDNNGQVPFPPAQIASLVNLLTDLTTRWHIPRAQIIGHEDMAPSRKDDPEATVRAFHDHFRGVGGSTLDAEDLRILSNLVGKVERGTTEK
jgi:N-acetylmuramoyl-L-alanine amidase